MGNGCTSQKSASLVNLNRDRIPSFKVILLGDSGVGKSSIIQRFRRNQFEEEYTPTKIVAIDNIVKKLNVPQNVLVSLAIWDIPSREDMDMGKTYYHNVDAVFVVVDLSEKDSIEMAGIWRQDFLNKASRSREIQTTLPKGGHIISLEPDKSFNPKDVPIILLGNKFDLVDSVDEVETEDVQEQVDEFLLSAEDADPAEKDGSVQDKEGNENTGETKITLGPTRDQDPVALLQEIEKHYYFATSSIPVSAKSKDGSVDEAFQAVIKHLLDKSKNFWPKLPNQSISQNEKKKKRKRNHPEFEVHFEKLALTGRNELDNLYQKCNNPMKRCQRYQRIYEGCLRRFMLRCVELQFLTDTRVDLQLCMMAIKEYVQKHMSRPLMVEEEDHFLKIYYDFDEVQDVTLLKQQRVFNKFLERFHKEYVAVCNGVMQEGLHLVERLSKQKSKILDIVEHLKEQRDSDEDDPETEWMEISEENIERIESSVKAMEDTFKIVERAKNIIQSSLSATEPEEDETPEMEQ